MGRQVAKWAALVAAATFGVVGAGSAIGASSAPDVSATSFATGFTPAGRSIGPVGLAFDGDQRLYVSQRGDLYRFGPQGGRADSAHRVNSSPIPGQLSGLAMGLDGRLYAARRTSATQGDVVELAPDSGAIIREVAGGIACPTGLAVDPSSGDLFVSSVGCADQVLRIHGGQVSQYVTGVHVDGLAFSPDGTLYLAHDPDADGYTISSVPGTASGDRTRTPLAKVSRPDGIAIAASDATSGQAPFLIVNRLNGSITRIDLTSSDHPSRDLMTDGSRGDFVVVGPDGCLYATQTSEVLKVTNSDGSCRSGGPLSGLAPTGPLLPPTSAFLKVGSAKRCSANRRLTVRFRAPRGVHVRRARLYIGGTFKRRVTGTALRRKVTLTKLPRTRFTLTIRATTTKGRRLTVRRKYKACSGVVVKAKKKKPARKPARRKRA